MLTRELVAASSKPLIPSILSKKEGKVVLEQEKEQWKIVNTMFNKLWEKNVCLT